MWDLRWKKWHWNGPVCDCFGFPLSDYPTSAPFSWSESCGMWRRVTFLKFSDVLNGRSSVLFLDCCMVTKWLLPIEASLILYEWTERNVPEDLDLHEHRCELLTQCTQHLHFYLQKLLSTERQTNEAWEHTKRVTVVRKSRGIEKWRCFYCTNFQKGIDINTTGIWGWLCLHNFVAQIYGNISSHF